MTRTAITYSAATVNGSLADPAGTAVVAGAGNGGQIAQAPFETLFLRVVGTVAGNLTVLSGKQPLALASGQDGLAVAVPAGTVWVGPLESGRFEQNDASLIFETDQAMTVTAFRVPRH